LPANAVDARFSAFRTFHARILKPVMVQVYPRARRATPEVAGTNVGATPEINCEAALFGSASHFIRNGLPANVVSPGYFEAGISIFRHPAVLKQMR
jgi:hypothetical protein